MKPVNESGMTCPLMGKACKKVCHTCELWHPLDVVKADGTQGTEWRCSFNWTPYLHVVQASRLDGMGQALEGMRNKFADYAKMSAKLMVDLPRMLLGLAPPPPKDGGQLDAGSSS